MRTDNELFSSLSRRTGVGIALAAVLVTAMMLTGCGSTGTTTGRASTKNSTGGEFNVAAAQTALDRTIAAHPVTAGETYAHLSACPLGDPRAILDAAGLSKKFDPSMSAATPYPSGPVTDLSYTVEPAVSASDGAAQFPGPRVACWIENYDGDHGREFDIAAYDKVTQSQFVALAQQVNVPVPATSWHGGKLFSACKAFGHSETSAPGSTGAASSPVRSAFFATSCFAAWSPSSQHFAIAVGCTDNGAGDSTNKRDPRGGDCRQALIGALPVVLAELVAGR